MTPRLCGAEYENAAATETPVAAESAVDQPFLPVSKVRVHASGTGHGKQQVGGMTPSAGKTGRA